MVTPEFLFRGTSNQKPLSSWASPPPSSSFIPRLVHDLKGQKVEHMTVVFENLGHVGTRSHFSTSRILLPVDLRWCPELVPGCTINKISQPQSSFKETSWVAIVTEGVRRSRNEGLVPNTVSALSPARTKSIGFCPRGHFCSSWYSMGSSSDFLLGLCSLGRLMTQVTSLSRCCPSIGSFPCPTGDLMTSIWQDVGPVEPNGFHVGFLAVAISGLSTELFPTVDYLEQREEMQNEIGKSQ